MRSDGAVLNTQKTRTEKRLWAQHLDLLFQSGLERIKFGSKNFMPVGPIPSCHNHILHTDTCKWSIVKCIIQPGQVDLILKHVFMSWFWIRVQVLFWSHLDSNFSRDLNAGAHGLAKFCAKTEMEQDQAQLPISDSGPGPHLSELRTRSELMHAYGKWS